MRLLNLSSKAQSLLLKHKTFTMGHGRALLSLSLEEQDKAAGMVVNGNLTVRETEQLVKNWRNQLSLQHKSPSFVDKETLDYYQHRLVNNSINIASTRLKFTKNSPNTGQVILNFSSNEELDRILDIISPENE